jgi:transposase
MVKYTKQIKLKVVKQYLAEGLGYHRLSAKLGIPSFTIRRWVSAYLLHGDGSFARRQVHYSAEFKLSVLQYMWDNATTINQTAAVFNIPHPDSVRTWAKSYNSGGIEALGRIKPAVSNMPARVTPPDDKPVEELTREELLKRVQYLQMEVAVLKKLEALAQAKKAAAKAAVPKKRK